MKTARLCLHLTLLLAASAARADDRADALLGRVATAYDRLPVLRANIRVVVTARLGEMCVTTGHIKLVRPNLARLELTEQTSVRTNHVLVICDGKMVWEWRPSDNVCYRWDAEPKGLNGKLFASWLDLYYDPLTAIRSDYDTRQTRYLRAEKLDGLRCQVVEITETPVLISNADRTTTTQLYVDEEGLVRKVVQTGEDWPLSPRTTTTTFDFVDLHGSDAVDPSEYIFDLPKGATLKSSAEDDIALPSASNAAHPAGWTPLMEAAFQGRLASVRVLCAQGADIMAKDADGYTPLMCALTRSRPSGVANFLLEKGSDVNSRDRFGRTPLILAAKYGVASIIEPLLSRGADVNAKDDRGETALMHTQRGDIGALLMAHGAEVNIRDRAGQTPLTLAARGGQSGLVRALLAKGADPNAQEPNGATAISHARAGRYTDIVEMLRAAGAESN